jgi:peptide/nickel transport system substrate-binding protein
MTRWSIHACATFGAALAALSAPATAEKYGGILRSYSIDSPASLSIHEEVTIYALRPVMGVFNNLVMYDQHVKQNSMASIVPDLAASWSWDEDGIRLTFKLHEGVKWHDSQPFTARDVKCTWDLLQGKTSEKLRINPRKAWYRNLEEVTTNGDFEATFRLKRPQPAFLALLASGFSPVYPCHVSPRDMRQHPIGTGPFKLVEFKPNESIKLIREDTPAVQAADLLAWQWYTDKRHELEGRPRRKDCARLLNHHHNAVHVDEERLYAIARRFPAGVTNWRALLQFHEGDRS